MSIVTLKKKTQTQYNNMSVGMKQFSLNGGHRSQGYIGQESLSRTLCRTLSGGNQQMGYALKGHGGCWGTFPIINIQASETFSTEDISVIKPSVISNDGMIETKYMWVNRPQPFSTVKSDNSRNINSQSDYISRLEKSTLQDILTNCPSQPKIYNCCNNTTTNYNYLSINATGNITKDMQDMNNQIVALDYSSYLQQLDKSCISKYTNPTFGHRTCPTF